MLCECRDQELLKSCAFQTTSCGRYKQHGYKHCGRCVPCLVRRAAIRAWKKKERTQYVYGDLGRDDNDHAGFDDVRSVLLAIAECRDVGIMRWLGATLSSDHVTNKPELAVTIERGLREIQGLLRKLGAK